MKLRYSSNPYDSLEEIEEKDILQEEDDSNKKSPRKELKDQLA